jgi:uroporphyrinogen-III synthase
VFTSPSNVEAFFEMNSISPAQRVVAIGGATAAALKEKGITKVKQPGSFDDIGLAQAVMSA